MRTDGSVSYSRRDREGERLKEHRTNLANAPSPDLGHEAWPEVDGQVQTHHIFIDVRVSTDVDIERG